MGRLAAVTTQEVGCLLCTGPHLNSLVLKALQTTAQCVFINLVVVGRKRGGKKKENQHGAIHKSSRRRRKQRASVSVAAKPRSVGATAVAWGGGAGGLQGRTGRESQQNHRGDFWKHLFSTDLAVKCKGTEDTPLRSAEVPVAAEGP